ncbi:ATP-binding protein [Sporomusa acidovorans]|uniref:histidine kinase n=1 Tax=Sporomusa acidovorans (strain ATCC 49682 / DSM 3132 / Mol) TaxID=1123286 RepID=A0ABZ3J0K2_SPOA4|nr:ATP-binding protein [Sporomusa acidovorans]OZC22811.1 sporulation kinase E [Sporomusa acidovorans DSM 3132]SDE51623.1 PAS domain S-box-containing protein [Sporomusa acidovorans]
MLKSRFGKLFFCTVSMLTLLMMVADYSDVKDECNLQYLNRERELMQVATRLNDELSSFDQIVRENNAENLDADTQTQVLNRNLQLTVMKISEEHPNVGLGYYSRKLDRNVALGPRLETGFLKKITAPGALEIYQTGNPKTFIIEESILWDGKPILAVHYPIKRNGEIIGHSFANAKIEDIEAAYRSGVVTRVSRMGLVWLITVIFISVMFYRIRQVVAGIIRRIENEEDDYSQIADFPEFLPILKTVTKLRGKIRSDHHRLMESNSKLFKLMDICPLSILELDKAGNIVSLNEPMVAFYKNYLPYSKDELIGKSIRTLSSELGINFEESFIARLLNGQEIRNELVERLKRYWMVNGIPIYHHETNEFAGCYAFYQDITQWENFKSEMARLESLNAIGETAGSVAHELRNPATTIKGFVQLMSLKCNEQQGKYFAIILEELERMNNIIEDFLSLARHRFIAKSPNDLNQILQGIYPLLLADATKNDIELHYNLCDAIKMIELNPKEMRQVILNIVRNGIEATPRKGHLYISTINVPKGIELIISDTGSGIPEDSLACIFEPFYTSKKSGTGLGLAVCKNIVEAHRGKIKVASKVGQGTTFTIFFPNDLFEQ